MTPESLRAIIDAGESLQVEFKGEAHRQLSDIELVEAVVCLANRPGDGMGWLLVGVEDDGSISGARPRHGSNIDPIRVQALIANRTHPPLTCRVEVVPLDPKPVLAIEVPVAPTRVGTADGRYLRRIIGGKGKPECVPLYPHEFMTWQVERGFLDYSSLAVSGVVWDDLDTLEFERLRRMIRESRGQGDTSLLELSDLELAKALGAIEANHEVKAIRVLGLLLFGKEESLQRYLPTHEVAFQVFADLQVEVNDFFKWPLFRTIEEIASRFRARNREEELMLGLFRLGLPNYSERAFREGVANALIHRDYTLMGAIHIQWHDDRVEISSPGGFPEGVRLDNLLVTPPRPRNPLLADAFKRAGIVERTARGIDTIFYEQLRNGRPAPSYERSNEANVILVLRGGDANLAFVGLVVEEQQAGRPLKLDELLLINHLFLERRLNTAAASQIIQKPEMEARALLGRLVEAGLVEARGEGKGRTYHLSASTYRRLGGKEAYVRTRGFEPLQQEQMVLQYVENHGQISRAEVATLCQLNGPQAYRLLNSLVKKDLLSPLSSRGRGVRYAKKSR